MVPNIRVTVRVLYGVYYWHDWALEENEVLKYLHHLYLLELNKHSYKVDDTFLKHA